MVAMQEYALSNDDITRKEAEEKFVSESPLRAGSTVLYREPGPNETTKWKMNTISPSRLLTFHSSPCLHREKISRLRDEWLEKELCHPPPPTPLSPTFSTSDSGMGSSTSPDDAGNNHRLSLSSRRVALGESSKVLCIDLDEDTLIASIQNEAKTSQHMVNMAASTRSMRRQRNDIDDLTYRRRSLRARKSLSSYIPVAPCHAYWGEIFDEMISELRGEPKVQRSHECPQCNGETANDNASVYDNDLSVKEFPSPREALEFKTNKEILKSPWLANSVSDYVIADVSDSDRIVQHRIELHESTAQTSGYDYVDYEQSMDGLDKEPTTADDTEAFWEENWSDNHTEGSSTEDGENSLQTPCDACNGGQPPQTLIKPTLCYRNQKCPSFGTSASSVVLTPDSATGADTQFSNVQAESLKDVSFRRPDLAAINLPLSPLRKTESNRHVWVEMNDEEVDVKAKKQRKKRSLWKRIKRLFS